MGDIIRISELAVRVYTAYKDAPDNYRNISEEVIALQVLIDEAEQHFESTAISDDDRQDGEKILKGCQSVLEDLNSLIEKYKSLASASTNEVLVFKRVKLGSEDIATLRARLTSNATLLSSFIRRFNISTIYFFLIFYANIYTLDANSLKCRGSSMIFLACIVQLQEFQWTLLLLLLAVSILRRLTRSFVKTFFKLGLRRR